MCDRRERNRTAIRGLEGRCSTVELRPRGASQRIDSRARPRAADGRPVIDASDDLRLALASALHPGDALELVAAGGAQLDVEIERIDGVDFRVHIDSPVPLPVGSLLAGRVHDGAEAWFCTFIALDAAEIPTAARCSPCGSATPTASRPSAGASAAPSAARPCCAARASSDVLRGVTVDASAVGIAVQLPRRRRDRSAPCSASRWPVSAAAASPSAASCAGARGRARAACSGVEIADISPEDRARLVRALGSRRRLSQRCRP